MTAEYPKEQQNPPTEPGMRPGDQPEPRVRVPESFDQERAAGDPRGIDSGRKPGEHLEQFGEKHAEERTE